MHRRAPPANRNPPNRPPSELRHLIDQLAEFVDHRFAAIVRGALLVSADQLAIVVQRLRSCRAEALPNPSHRARVGPEP